MKQILKTLLIISILGNSFISNAQNVVIPNAIFKAALVGNLAINTNADAEIQVSEATVYNGSINVYNQGISDLTGIEAFTALTNLNCSKNSLTSINVSSNTALTNLSCYDNTLTSLNVSSNTALTNLSCGGNSLTSINVSSNTALTYISCGGNSLTSLNVSSNIALTYLECSVNSISSLNASLNPGLTYINCSENSLTSLNVSSNPALTYINCSNNLLTSLNVSSSPALTYIDCTTNSLTSLNVSSCPALTDLYTNFNPITSLNVSSNPALIRFSCYGNSLTSLNISSNTAIAFLNCGNNNLSFLNVKNGNNINFTDFYAIGNPILTCISVDNTAWANTNWNAFKDATASFNTVCSFPLSFKLISFTANQCNSTNACINWQTTDEQNFKNYELQQSQDGILFKTIYTVNGKNGTTNDYQFVDENKSGTVYYRLKMNDIDGQFTYSSNEKIDFGKLATIEITPNPASSIVTLIGLDNIQKIDIISLQGQVLKTILVNANQSTIDISNIPNGIYQLKLSSKHQSQTERLVVEH